MKYYDDDTMIRNSGEVIEGLYLNTGRMDNDINVDMPHLVEGVMELLAGVVVDEGQGVDVKRWERTSCWPDGNGGMECDEGVKVGEDENVMGLHRQSGMKKVVLLERYEELTGLGRRWSWELVRALRDESEWGVEFWDAKRVWGKRNGEGVVCFREMSFPGGRFVDLPPAFYQAQEEGQPFGIRMDAVLDDADPRAREVVHKQIVLGGAKDNDDVEEEETSLSFTGSLFKKLGWKETENDWNVLAKGSARERSECVTRVLILSRKESRSLVRVDALEKVLHEKTRKEGMFIETRVVEFENTSFVEQAAHVRWADVLVTAHGAALANLIFLRPRSTVIEIVPWGYRVNFQSHARIMGSRHVLITAKPQSDSVHECLMKHATYRNRTMIQERIKQWNASVEEYERRGLDDTVELQEHPFWTFTWGNTTNLRICARIQSLDFEHEKAAKALIAHHIQCR